MALIDYVAEKCDLFISDLKVENNEIRILELLEQLPDDSAFSLGDWNRFAEYLFAESLNFSDVVQARRTCIDRLTQAADRV